MNASASPRVRNACSDRVGAAPTRWMVRDMLRGHTHGEVSVMSGTARSTVSTIAAGRGVVVDAVAARALRRCWQEWRASGDRVDATWMSAAACAGRDPELWFPPEVSRRAGFDPGVVAEAVAVCGECPVREECLAAALREERASGIRHGIRGGMLPKERAVVGA